MDWNRVEVVLNFSLEKFVNIEIYDFRFSTVPNSWPDLFQYNFSSFLFFFLFTYVCVWIEKWSGTMMYLPEIKKKKDWSKNKNMERAIYDQLLSE